MNMPTRLSKQEHLSHHCWRVAPVLHPTLSWAVVAAQKGAWWWPCEWCLQWLWTIENFARLTTFAINPDKIHSLLSREIFGGHSFCKCRILSRPCNMLLSLSATYTKNTLWETTDSRQRRYTPDSSTAEPLRACVSILVQPQPAETWLRRHYWSACCSSALKFFRATTSQHWCILKLRWAYFQIFPTRALEPWPDRSTKVHQFFPRLRKCSFVLIIRLQTW